MIIFSESDNSRLFEGIIKASLTPKEPAFKLATAKVFITLFNSSSTSNLKARFFLIKSMYWRTISSCLSLSNLWPRTEVANCFFNFVNSILVGLTLILAIVIRPYSDNIYQLSSSQYVLILILAKLLIISNLNQEFLQWFY